MPNVTSNECFPISAARVLIVYGKHAKDAVRRHYGTLMVLYTRSQPRFDRRYTENTGLLTRP